MARAKKDPKRERRIEMEIVVDCYDSEERVMGWYYYLEDALQFPFRATCIAQRAVSPLRKGEEVDVLRMAPDEERQRGMFVIIPWQGRTLGVPLAQLMPVPKTDKKTKEAVADWHYWVAQGYEF